ncbi:hypothetical protein BSL78_20429 [Apostichopus japonicus]|uniref:Uncharacterized protein n=1 Tax=Stichopus japonicus TaxID=307972 RepID=A0A2G8K425_STIJA|nr:hypothetical protein BSL78_20429 [Apostichopus japonicus]
MSILFYLPGKLLRDGQHPSLPSSNPCNYDSSRGLNNEAHTGVFWGEASFPEVHLVLLHNAVMIAISLTFPFVKIYSEIFLLTFVLGLMRPLGNNIPYLLGEELLGTQLVDEAVTITCVACGLGLVLGALPMVNHWFIFYNPSSQRLFFFPLQVSCLRGREEGWCEDASGTEEEKVDRANFKGREDEVETGKGTLQLQRRKGTAEAERDARWHFRGRGNWNGDTSDTQEEKL